ncbi:hypothetical protein IE077_000982 [Cardiosporidium cionae]|uniref:RNA-editing substrate-binding complex 6 protein domain-containing protein n=1 Tax=Cardiosporidium cionae TaxID=476202 RepID=A0ABQ7JH30_9APIC|nr:hypothetical protein IE077_000982 [Cardiosporidium cionae]|eukprot:KAF8823060.1 hypothetical protein IE077_000982 [Cardiosporidium cionae]
MLRLSNFLSKGGPARALCRPTRVGSSDGPFRYHRFKLRPMNRDYQQVLVTSNVKSLYLTAEKVLKFPNEVKTPAFWPIFAQRIKESAHLLSPADVVIFLRAFQGSNRQYGLLFYFASNLPSRIGQADGATIVTLIGIISKTLKSPTYSFLYEAVCKRIPDILYQLSVPDILSILNALKYGRVTDATLCSRFSKKIIAHLDFLDAPIVAALSVAFAEHGCREVYLYTALANRAAILSEEFDKNTLFSLLTGFHKLEINCDEVLKSVSPTLIKTLPTFSKYLKMNIFYDISSQE